MAQLRLYTLSDEYFVCGTVEMFIKRFNGLNGYVDYDKTFNYIMKARQRDLSLRYNYELNTLLSLHSLI